ncbi:MAG: hypothetical protein EA382_07145 [Spirochaetaceae bacterium]|nr:MAG: hypothetical protein EA382_07145 [Spirochaetaceae bacterium]
MRGVTTVRTCHRVRACCTLIVAVVLGAAANADVPYNTYTFDWRGFPTASPHAYVPQAVLTGATLGVGSLSIPAHLFVSPSGLLYVADSGNHRVLVFDDRFQLFRIVETFAWEGRTELLANPQGVFVDDREHLYVADTSNGRVVEFDSFGTAVNVFGRPDTELLDEYATYEPLKVVLDKARRIYVIARGVNQGLIELDSDGRFRGFMGANRVTPNALDFLWKLIATDEQRARMVRFVPTEYSNAVIDSRGYIFVTTASVGTDAIMQSLNPDDLRPIRKLNLTGTDVLRTLDNQWPPVGDISIGLGFGAVPSQFVDVALGVAETYVTLDRVRGKVFIYDSDGILLAAFGRIGDRIGTFRGPSSITYLGDRLLVLDSILNQIIVFQPTEYGRLLFEANRLYQERSYAESAAAWQRVQELNTNLEVAYAGVGRAQLRGGYYSDAMESFRLAHSPSYYSRAFQRHRRVIVERYFSVFMAALLGLIAVWIVVRARRRRRRRRTNA